MRTLLGRALAVVLFLALVMAAPAAADMVTVAVTGRVTDALDFDTIDNGSAVTGYYRYDDTTADTATWSDYYGLYHGVEFHLGFADGSTISSTTARIVVNNDSSGHGTVDEYLVRFPSLTGFALTGAFAEIDPVLSMDTFIGLRDDRGAALTSDALPNPAGILSAMPDYWSRVQLETIDSFGNPEYYVGLRFEVTDLSVVPVPVPGALVLVGLGLSSSGWLLRRRRNGSA